MPILSNARHEAFAQGVAKGKSAAEAYRDAGYEGDRRAASNLWTNMDVQARVEELQARAADLVVVDRSWVISKLTENVERSMQAQPVMVGGQPSGEFRYDGSVANKALELLGKEIGMFVERSENVNHNYDISDEPASEDEWAEQHALPN